MPRRRCVAGAGSCWCPRSTHSGACTPTRCITRTTPTPCPTWSSRTAPPGGACPPSGAARCSCSRAAACSSLPSGAPHLLAQLPAACWRVTAGAQAAVPSAAPPPRSPQSHGTSLAAASCSRLWGVAQVRTHPGAGWGAERGPGTGVRPRQAAEDARGAGGAAGQAGGAAAGRAGGAVAPARDRSVRLCAPRCGPGCSQAGLCRHPSGPGGRVASQRGLHRPDLRVPCAVASLVQGLLDLAAPPAVIPRQRLRRLLDGTAGSTHTHVQAGRRTTSSWTPAQWRASGGHWPSRRCCPCSLARAHLCFRRGAQACTGVTPWPWQPQAHHRQDVHMARPACSAADRRSLSGPAAQLRSAHGLACR